MSDKRIYVCGIGRSGTNFMWSLLRAAGFPDVVHETTQVDHSQCTWYRVPENLPQIAEHWVVHLVRDPLKIAASHMHNRWYREDGSPYKHLVDDVPVLAQYEGMERVVAGILGWHYLILPYAAHPNYLRYRLEDPPESLLAALGAPVTHDLPTAPTNVSGKGAVYIKGGGPQPANFEAQSPPTLTLDDIPETFRDQFHALRTLFGYD